MESAQELQIRGNRASFSTLTFINMQGVSPAPAGLTSFNTLSSRPTAYLRRASLTWFAPSVGPSRIVYTEAYTYFATVEHSRSLYYTCHSVFRTLGTVSR